MDALLPVVTDLTKWVSVFEQKQNKGEPSVIHSQVNPTPIDEIAPNVHRRVAERLRRAITLTPVTEDEAMSDEEEHPHPRRGNNLKSGMQRTGASTVIHKVTWPHEVVYTSEGNPASYQDLTIPLFVQGYLIVMELEQGPVKKLMSTHLQDLMSDTQWYGWDKVRTFHGVWLNQIEQGRCTWTDKEEKLNFRRALVWHPTSTSLPAPPMNRGRNRQHTHKPPSDYHAPARPGTKACQTYNTVGCTQWW